MNQLEEANHDKISEWGTTRLKVKQCIHNVIVVYSRFSLHELGKALIRITT